MENTGWAEKTRRWHLNSPRGSILIFPHLQMWFWGSQVNIMLALPGAYLLTVIILRSHKDQGVSLKLPVCITIKTPPSVLYGAQTKKTSKTRSTKGCHPLKPTGWWIPPFDIFDYHNYETSNNKQFLLNFIKLNPFSFVNGFPALNRIGVCNIFCEWVFSDLPISLS